ncbi:MAG: DNA replication and repair protein RecF [Spirochaetota bacterium]|nr:DNA replication and repair protein RecF [Spirochaetota bacterium]
MYIRRLRTKNFRNYSELELEFYSGFNYIIGPNAVGKTNIIEAISITSNSRSFRGVIDSDLIKWGETSYYCCSEVENNENSMFEIGCAIINNRLKKRAKIDGISINRTSDYYGRFLSVSLIPEDINIIMMTPDVRRRFFDGIISKIDKEYLINLKNFKKILSSRNTLLKHKKQGMSLNYDELDVWDTLFADKANYIIKRRIEFLTRYKESFKQAYIDICKDDEHPNIEYLNTLNSIDKDDIINELLRNRKRDISIGSSSLGPQRDDYCLINRRGVKFKNFASQGQKRTATISLKIAEYKFIESETGKRSIILIDDIFSELDEERKKNMIKTFKDNEQVIVTMVENREIFKSDNYKVFQINSGGIVTEQ